MLSVLTGLPVLLKVRGAVLDALRHPPDGLRPEK
jgi:hypothetical protein